METVRVCLEPLEAITTTRHPYKTDTRYRQDKNGIWVAVRREPGASVAPKPANDNSPAAHAERRARADQEIKAMAKERRRIRKRQNIGDPGIAHSRDEDFPLLAVLRRDRRADAIKAVLMYRQLVALCAAEPLKGVAYGSSDTESLPVQYQSKRLRGIEEVNQAAAEKFATGVAGGEIEYSRKIRRSKGAYPSIGIRKTAIDADAYLDVVSGSANVGLTETLHIKVTEDALLDRIDKYPVLMRIRTALGPLVDLFDDAVLGGRTLTRIGKRCATGTSAAIAGKALVMEAVEVVIPFFVAQKYRPANDNYLIEKRKIA